MPEGLTAPDGCPVELALGSVLHVPDRMMTWKSGQKCIASLWNQLWCSVNSDGDIRREPRHGIADTIRIRSDWPESGRIRYGDRIIDAVTEPVWKAGLTRQKNSTWILNEWKRISGQSRTDTSLYIMINYYSQFWTIYWISNNDMLFILFKNIIQYWL